MSEMALAFDTSNYTTSCAVFDGVSGENVGKLLDVKPGELGLRQSEALFAHVKRLPELASRLLPVNGTVIAVGASETPREIEGSYMPCFLAGVSVAKVCAAAMGVPYYGFSHQQGHIAAAAWSAGRLDLLETKHLAWHLSGGTTELLLVHPEPPAVRCEIVGGTTDVSAGQLIDRAGKALGLQFPAGKELDRLSKGVRSRTAYRPKMDSTRFSLSGVEQKLYRAVESGETPEDIAYFVLASLCVAVEEATMAAKRLYGDLPVLYSGGVSSNTLLRENTPDGIFAGPEFSTDNAMGVAILAMRAVREVKTRDRA